MIKKIETFVYKSKFVKFTIYAQRVAKIKRKIRPVAKERNRE